MGKHTKKIIAPAVIVALITVYEIVFCAIVLSEEMSLLAKIAGIAIPAGIFCVSVYVLWERIKEIRSGEEDDLSNY